MDFDVLIVGGGIAGLAQAISLRHHKVAVLEKSKLQITNQYDNESEYDTRIYAISPINKNYLQQTGVWDHLDNNRLTSVQRMCIYGDTNGRLEFNAYESGVSELAWIAESSKILQELINTAMRHPNIHLLEQVSPSSLFFNTDHVCLSDQNGQEYSAKLIIAADGADSWVRKTAGIKVQIHDYQQYGLVANFSCQRSHSNTAYQWFLPEGVLAWLPLPGNRFSMVWSTQQEKALNLQELSAEELSLRVAEAGANTLGKLQLLNKPRFYPLRLMRAKPVVLPRLALVGDAAHTIHPLSGHGINLGLQDTQTLAGILNGCAEYEDPGYLSVLRSYARRRKEQVLVMQTVTDGLQRLFANRSPIIGKLRNQGMHLVMDSALRMLRAKMAHYAMFS